MNWMFLIILGVLSILAGLFALFNPLEGSIAATLIAGWSFLVLGILEIIAAFRAEGWGARIWAILLGIVAVLVGANLIGEPLRGMITLTIVVGILLLTSGVVKLVIGFGVEGNLRWAILLSAVASLILGGIILMNFPQSAAITLGVILGIELISNGISMIAMGSAGRALKDRIGSA